jgi:hypothetical protein
MTGKGSWGQRASGPQETPAGVAAQSGPLSGQSKLQCFTDCITPAAKKTAVTVGVSVGTSLYRKDPIGAVGTLVTEGYALKTAVVDCKSKCNESEGATAKTKGEPAKAKGEPAKAKGEPAKTKDEPAKTKGGDQKGGTGKGQVADPGADPGPDGIDETLAGSDVSRFALVGELSRNLCRDQRLATKGYRMFGYSDGESDQPT